MTIPNIGIAYIAVNGKEKAPAQKRHNPSSPPAPPLNKSRYYMHRQLSAQLFVPLFVEP